MKQIGWITLFSLLFSGSLGITLLCTALPKLNLPTESINKLMIPPSSGKDSKILPDTTVNSSNLNLLINPERKIIGGTCDGNWFHPRDLIPYLNGTRIYRIFSKNGFLDEVKGQSVREQPFRFDQPEYTIEWNSKIAEPAFALNGGWDPFPRIPQYINDDHDRYYSLVKKVLSRLKLEAAVRINQIVQVDLEGDGNDEILIEAGNIDGSLLDNPDRHALQDAYSLIILCQTIEGLGKETVISGSYREPTQHTLLFTADVNGDWTMEFLIRTVAMETRDSLSSKSITDTLFRLEEKQPQKVLQFHFNQISDK